MGCVLAVSLLFQGYRVFFPSQNNAADNMSGSMETAAKYTCPMHPQIISDTRGQCPICGMDMVKIGHKHGETNSSTAPQDSTEPKVLYWYDPMRPEQHFDKPGKSPFMDMQLVPKYSDEVGEIATGSKPVISISAENIQKMGVRTGKAIQSVLGGGLRATGVIIENERTRQELFSQVEGRVDELKYSAMGDKVKKDNLFYTLYSPELLALQNDYLAALNSGYKDLAASARKRMKLLGVDDKVIETLTKTRKAYDRVPFYIPIDGILGQLEILNGSYLKVNSRIGQIQDLSTVWVEAAISEKDLAKIKEGDTAKVTVSGGKSALEATVDYIYPTVNPETRTGKARLVVKNPDYLLKPSGYVTVEFSTASTERLTVPNSAILRESSGEHVIVSLGGGKFQARDVQTGAIYDGRTEILQGLAEGEEIVMNGQFLIDSESNLQESLDKIGGGSDESK